MAAIVQDFQHELDFAFLEGHGDTVAVCYNAPATPVFVNELAVEPDLEAVVGADAKNTTRLLSYIDLGSASFATLKLLVEECYKS